MYRSCIALDARRWFLRTSKCTWRAYLVRYKASSVAVSPPPTTARTCPLNSGDAPSHIAQALIPLLQNSSSRGNLSLLAVAPVAMIRLWHFTYNMQIKKTWIHVSSSKLGIRISKSKLNSIVSNIVIIDLFASYFTRLGGSQRNTSHKVYVSIICRTCNQWLLRYTKLIFFLGPTGLYHPNNPTSLLVLAHP